MKRYAIWNKEDAILTPAGTIYTAEEWKERYPIAALDHITVVCSAGEINGAFFGTLGQMMRNAELEGCSFKECKTPEAILEKIECFNEERAKELANIVTPEQETARALSSIAASLEYQNLLSLEDIEE